MVNFLQNDSELLATWSLEIQLLTLIQSNTAPSIRIMSLNVLEKLFKHEKLVDKFALKGGLDVLEALEYDKNEAVGLKVRQLLDSNI
jgi:hypothetical protein